MAAIGTVWQDMITVNMRIFAYCTAPARESVAQAMGMEPYTSPPWVANTFNPDVLIGYDLLYFRLHQARAFPDLWLGQKKDGGLVPAFRVEQLETVRLGSPIVLIANCYGVEGPFVPAFYRAGARAVIAAPGPNFAAGNVVIGTDLLAKWLIRGLRWGLSVGRALTMAKARLVTTAWRDSDRDALQFKIMEV